VLAQAQAAIAEEENLPAPGSADIITSDGPGSGSGGTR
jgi:hypothetical protein